MANPLWIPRKQAMWQSGLKNWKEMVWYGWVIGAALIAFNASIAYLLGFETIPAFWGL
jgi:hypothetical protein